MIKPDITDSIIMHWEGVTNGTAAVQDLTLRFAVAAFDTWKGMQPALRHLSEGGSPQHSFNYLGLQRILMDAGPAVTLQPLPFPGNRELISCSEGPVAMRLAGRLGTGAPTLQGALGQWLIPRHAARLGDLVESGGILLWVHVPDSESERRAYQSLLAQTSHPVGVHDLIGE